MLSHKCQGWRFLYAPKLRPVTNVFEIAVLIYFDSRDSKKTMVYILQENKKKWI